VAAVMVVAELLIIEVEDLVMLKEIIIIEEKYQFKGKEINISDKEIHSLQLIRDFDPMPLTLKGTRIPNLILLSH